MMMKAGMLLVAMTGCLGHALASTCLGEQCPIHSEDMSMLQLVPTWDWLACSRWLDQAVGCMEASAQRIADTLPEVVIFYDKPGEGFEGTVIEDGKSDMFDGGNGIVVGAKSYGFSQVLNYTQQCGGSWTSAGIADVEYFTCRVDVNITINPTPDHNECTVWFAGFRSKRGLIDSVVITGELGSDVDGFTQSGYAGRTASGLRGLYTQTLETGDPSVNHLLIVPGTHWENSLLNPNPVTIENTNSHPRPPHSKNGAHGIPVHAAFYALWGGGVHHNNIAYTVEQFNAALEAITDTC